MTQVSDFNSMLREDALDVHLSAGEAVQAPTQRADFIFDFSRDDILQFQRVGDDLIIILNDGSSVRIMDYYLNSYENALVFTGTTEAGVGGLPIAIAGGALLGLSGLALSAARSGSGGGRDRGAISVNDNTGGADKIINADERLNGTTLSGTATPGSLVSVTIGDITHESVADENGLWSVVFASADLPVGEKDIQVGVTAVDPDGNVNEITSTITLDTLVNTLTLNDVPGGVDQVINLEEAIQGLEIGGEVEPGSTVVVQFDGREYPAVVDGSGNWSVTIPPSFVPDSNGGEFLFSATATDSAGNTRTINDVFVIDTVAPDAPIVEAIHQTLNGIDGVSTATPETGTVGFYQVSETGEITSIGISEATTSGARGETDFTFSTTVSSGFDLILSVQDAVGNINSTYQVFDNGSAVSMNNPQLGAYGIDAINLFFANAVELTLTEIDIENLSSSTNTVTIFGRDDDTVILAGATHNGSVIVAGETFSEYYLGDTTVLIDEFVDVVI